MSIAHSTLTLWTVFTLPMLQFTNSISLIKKEALPIGDPTTVQLPHAIHRQSCYLQQGRKVNSQQAGKNWEAKFSFVPPMMNIFAHLNDL